MLNLYRNDRYDFLFWPLWLMIICLVGCYFSPYAEGSVGVRPLEINLEIPSDKKGEFELFVYSTSTSKKATPVHISVMDAFQREDGGMDFTDAGKTPYSCAQWIKLDKTDVIVPAGGNIPIKGEVLVPRGSSGSKIAVIMVEIKDRKKVAGARVNLRYAVSVNLDIKGRKINPRAELSELDLVSSPDGTPVIKVMMKNSSQINLRAQGRALIRDSSGRMITTLDLYTNLNRESKKGKEQNKKKKKEGKRLLPGAKVAFYGKCDKPLFPGEYTVIATMKYGAKSVSKKQKVLITEEMASKIKSPIAGFLEISPPYLELECPAGGSRLAYFQITNTNDQPVQVNLSVKDFEYGREGDIVIKDEGSTPYSASDWIMFDKRNYHIGPRLSQTVSLKVKAPSSAKAGHRYALVVVEKSATREGPEEKNWVMVMAKIPGEVKPEVEIINFECSKKEIGNQEFFLEIQNKGPIEIRPEGQVVIRDMYNNKVVEGPLKLETKVLLPHTGGAMTAVIRKKLIPGEYSAKAALGYGEGTTAEIKFTIQ